MYAKKHRFIYYLGLVIALKMVFRLTQDERDSLSNAFVTTAIGSQIFKQNKREESKQMETKSRYEIIAELEEKKADLINQQSRVSLKENSLKMDVERAEDALKNFVDNKEIQLLNLKDQLDSINKSLDRFDSQKTK